MIRALSLTVLALAVLAGPAPAAPDADRYSGRVVDVREGGQSLVIEEMGPWLGPDTRPQTRTVGVGPATSVRLVVPTGAWAVDTSPGYELRPIASREIRPGDFVTVTPGGARGAVAAVDVVRTASGDAGQASPSPSQGR